MKYAVVNIQTDYGTPIAIRRFGVNAVARKSGIDRSMISKAINEKYVLKENAYRKIVRAVNDIQGSLPVLSESSTVEETKEE